MRYGNQKRLRGDRKMKQVSKWLAILLAFSLLATPALAAGQTGTANQAPGDLKIVVNGTPITPTDVNGKTVDPISIDGTTYLPSQTLAESLGCAIDWDNATGTVTVSADDVQPTESCLKVGAGSSKIHL